MTATLSAEVIERLYAEARSRLGSSGGKKGTVSRQLKSAARTKHAKQLAIEAYSRELQPLKRKNCICNIGQLEARKTRVSGASDSYEVSLETQKEGRASQRGGSSPKRSG